MLRVEGLTTAYGAVCAVDGISFEVPRGSITAVLGANGAGKTSLLRTLSGLVRPRAGRMTLDAAGAGAATWPRRRVPHPASHDLGRMQVEDIVRAGMAHVPEGRATIDELDVEENLRLGALWRSDRADRAAALREVYDLFPPLRERARQAASTLSGGERQMLSIGRALMGRPRILLLDEPSLGLAPQISAQIMGLLRDLRERTGLTVLLVEQNARGALSIADHGIVLSVGRVVAADAPDRLLADDDLRHAYLGF